MTAIDDLRAYAPRKQHWFHSFEVMPGFWSDGYKSRETMDAEMHLWRFPEDLSGKTVLDIGCAGGGYSVAPLKRGAASVVAIDEQLTTGMRLFSAARPYPEISFHQISLFSAEFMDLPTFDVVIFAGVLYHVHDMLEALKRVRTKVRESVVLETIFNESLGISLPAAIFFESDEAGGDPTNWWGPNLPCLEALLRTAGFSFERCWMHRNEDGVTGRVAYRLTPAQDKAFSRVADGAIGSNGPLDLAHQQIERLRTENAELRARLGG